MKLTLINQDSTKIIQGLKTFYLVTHPGAPEDACPNNLEDLLLSFETIKFVQNELCDTALELEINKSPETTHEAMLKRFEELSILLLILAPACDLSINVSYNHWGSFTKLKNRTNELKLKTTNSTGGQKGFIAIPRDLESETANNLWLHIAALKVEEKDKLWDGDNLFSDAAIFLGLENASPQKPAPDTTHKEYDSDINSVHSASTEPPSPPHTPDSDDDHTVNLYGEEADSPFIAASTDPNTLIQDDDIEHQPENASAPKQQQEHEPEHMSVSEHHHKQKPGRVSPSALTEVERFSEPSDDLSDTTGELHTGNESMSNDYGGHSRQWYINNAEAINQYLQEDDIKVLEYLVDETAGPMNMMDSHLWQRVTQALLNLLLVGELPKETVEPYINAFHEAIRSKRIEYKVSYGKKPAKPLMSEEEIKIAIQQNEQSRQTELLESMREILESKEDLRIFHAIVEANQEDLLVNEKGWNRLQQIFALKDIGERWEEIRNKLIEQNFAESAWQAVGDFFIELEEQKDLALLDEVSEILSDEDVREPFKKLLDSIITEPEFIRESYREQILEFCEYVKDNSEKWLTLKPILLQASTPEEINKVISETLSEAANEARAIRAEEHEQRILEIRMAHTTRGNDEIITTGPYKIHRAELLEKLDPLYIDILDKFLTYPGLSPASFKRFWNETNSFLNTYLSAEYKKGSERNADDIIQAKQELEEHLSEMHEQYLGRHPKFKPSQDVKNLEIKPITHLLISTYYIARPLLDQTNMSTKYFDRIIAKILEDGNDDFLDKYQIDVLYDQLIKAETITSQYKSQSGITVDSLNEQLLDITDALFMVQLKYTHPVAGDALESLTRYINRVSSQTYKSGSDFYFFKDSRAKSRAKNCSFATEIKKQIAENPQNMSAILSEENIKAVKQRTGAKVTNSTELNEAIKSAQQALNKTGTTQQQPNGQSRKL